MKKQKYNAGGVISALAPLASFIPGAGPILSPLMGMAGGLISQQEAQPKYNSTGRMIRRATGGDLPLADNSFMVKGNPNQTDGNSYQAGGTQIKLDHNEVVKGNKVFSEDLKSPNGSSFAALALEIEKSMAKVDKALKSNPTDTASLNTKKILDKKSEKLFTQQEELAKAQGLRQSPTKAFRTGGSFDHIVDPETGKPFLPSGKPTIDNDSATNPGVDYSLQDGNMRAFAGGTIVKKGHQFNPDAEARSGTGLEKGRGYGNYVMVESTDPLTGQPVYMRYSHLSNAQAAELKEGAQIDRGFSFGAAATKSSPEVGSLTGPHTSVDFYADKDGTQTYKNSRALSSYAQHQIYNAQPLSPEEFMKTYNNPTTGDPLNPINAMAQSGLAGKTFGSIKGVQTLRNRPGVKVDYTPAANNTSLKDILYNTNDNRFTPNPIKMDIPTVPPVSPTTGGATSTTTGLNAGIGSKMYEGDPNKFNSKLGVGLQIGAAAANVLPLLGGYDKVKPHLDRTQITKENYDPTGVLNANQAEFSKAQTAINSSNVATKDAMYLSLFGKKIETDNKIRSQYDTMNQQAGSQYTDRVSNQARFNSGQLSQADNLTAANKGAYMNSISAALGSVSNLGQQMAARQDADKAIDLQNRQLQAKQDADSQMLKVVIGAMPELSKLFTK